jgi:hypothetical protein
VRKKKFVIWWLIKKKKKNYWQFWPLVRAVAMQKAWPRCASTEGSGRQIKRSANPTIPSPYDLAHLITFNIDESRICFSISTHP